MGIAHNDTFLDDAMSEAEIDAENTRIRSQLLDLSYAELVDLLMEHALPEMVELYGDAA